MKKDWTEILKDKLSESEVTPPDSLWEGISSKLDANLPQIQPSLKSRPKPKLWLGWKVAACIAALVGLVAYVAITNASSDPTQSDLLAQNTSPDTSFQNATSPLEEDQAVKSLESAIDNEYSKDASSGANLPKNSSQSSYKHSSSASNLTSHGQYAQNHPLPRDVQETETLENKGEDIQNTYSEQKEIESEEITSPIISVNEGVGLALNEDKTTEENVNLVNEPQSQEAYVDSIMNNYKECMENGNNPNSYPLMAENSTISNRGLSFEFYASSFGIAQSSFTEDMFADLNTPLYPPGPGDYVGNSPNDGPDMVNPEGPDDTEEPQSRSYNGKYQNTAKHHQPLRFGLSLRYPISSSISLSTGLVYSLLSSTLFSPEQSAITFETHQTLNYLGIPVSIEYKLPSYRKFGFYLTLGGMVEKCVYGWAKDSNSPVSYKVSERVFQTSAFAGAGVEYRLTNNASIYLEPLATYYFDNHSDIQNIYKDRKLNFDLRIGFRWSLKKR